MADDLVLDSAGPEVTVIKRVSNTHYWTRNMDAAIAFYRDALGLELGVRAGEDWAEFEVAGTTIALHGAREGHPPPSGGTVVFEVDDLDGALAGLRSKGIEIVGDVREAPTGRFASLRDPDGNIVQLFEPSDERG